VICISIICIFSQATETKSDVDSVNPIVLTISAGRLVTTDETTLFAYNCVSASGCMLNYFWFTAYYTNIENTRVRYYIDNESIPSIDFELYAAHAMPYNNPNDTHVVWSSDLFGRGAKTGGVFNLFNIPFSKSVRISVQKPQNADRDPVFWITLKGLDGTSLVTIGSDVQFSLPTIARLKLYKNENLALKPLEFVDLVNTKKSGIVIAVMISAEGYKFNFLEGCIRASIDGGSKQVLVSSGTEDYFQSAFYFDAGIFAFPKVGLTHLNGKTHPNSFSAYKIHIDDPLVFQNGIQLTWRNGDTVDPATGHKCTKIDGTPTGHPRDAVMSSYTWVYEW
jgi:hypothetical protein